MFKYIIMWTCIILVGCLALDVSSLAMSVAVWDKLGNEAQTTVQVSLDPAAPRDCDLLTRELCFWKQVSYRLYENRRGTNVGSLSSPYLAEMCPQHLVKYALLNGTKHLSITKSKSNPSKWNLKTLKALERDIIRHSGTSQSKFGVGAKVYFGVKCTVSSPSGTDREIEETLFITVMDENDNAPFPQSGDTHIDVRLKQGVALKDQINHLKSLMFIDRDSMSVNNYTFSILHDPSNIFGVNCSVFEDDREGEPQTAIHCKIWPRVDIPFPDSLYTIVLQINDTTMLPGYGESTINISISFHTNSSYPVAPAPALIRKQILYPHMVHILRYAAPFARVTQPKYVDPKHVKFSVRHDSSTKMMKSGAFNITNEEGILYVQDSVVLRDAVSPAVLEVQWLDTGTGKMQYDLVSVELAVESNSLCTEKRTSSSEWLHCADFVSPKSCTDACGLGTGGSSSVENKIQAQNGGHTRCVWRGDKKPGDTMTTLYSTCTPDVKTCPDKVCDPLEKLDDLICPQDCSEHVMWMANKNQNTGRGITSGKGVCKCDHFSKCVCGHHVMASGSSKKKTITTTTVTSPEPVTQDTSTAPPSYHPNTTVMPSEKMMEANASAHKAIDILKEAGPCGTTCLLGIGGAIVFLLGVITAVVACWRMGAGKDGRRGRKYVESINSLSGLQSDYTDRGHILPPDTLNLSFNMNRSITTNITLPKVMPVDPKWEFPREKLHIEQTLGEGEFGRVLRARALEIAGMPGYTTVAVKTLKEDAREAELADLMSEYQLLKEVSHPNVIKLLGASTLPGGPVYLIIEFAEHGSLRNYLRRSRHLEAEGQRPCSGAMLGALEPEPPKQPVCKISPRDILSFAWQISKGMAYLSDMKLVHRDLAARNVLLAEGMVCKVSDFGLTRDVYEDDNYLKRTKGRVPVKWMAPESLSDHIYNSKSDVWSFGILLWELVTLGASPYPGVAVQNLFHLLNSGYRMEKPDNCSPILYKIMKYCWHNEPGARPTFRTLTAKLEAMLADGIDYLDLTPKFVHNRTYFSTMPDTLTPDENDDTIGYGNLIGTNIENINLLTSPENKPKTSQSNDKLEILWKRPESPKACNGRPYMNEDIAQEMQHYESPIKIRNKEVMKNKERPQSYLDMTGEVEAQELLDKCNGEVKLARITSL